ncbi:hypothetical protein GVN21_15035 [Caulobacter sp. SLTY]|uniref:hypothetical protein n=1 Tax=Caulobacter sp. SLTY TaxID=2683262 RepID=UPI001412D9F9|nr:hypothetical protein [Caulobacter sp. SLTY]NBB16677.1 hypothetical protein [Caulobacter sp. SLTY]
MLPYVFLACLLDPVLWGLVTIGLALTRWRPSMLLGAAIVVGSALAVTGMLFAMRGESDVGAFMLSAAIRAAAAAAIVGLQLLVARLIRRGRTGAPR